MKVDECGTGPGLVTLIDARLPLNGLARDCHVPAMAEGERAGFRTMGGLLIHLARQNRKS